MIKDFSEVREESCCYHYMGYSFQLAARDILYAQAQRYDSIYLGLCYINCGALARTRNILLKSKTINVILKIWQTYY